MTRKIAYIQQLKKRICPKVKYPLIQEALVLMKITMNPDSPNLILVYCHQKRKRVCLYGRDSENEVYSTCI